MLLAEREKVILSRLNQSGIVSVRELAAACGVTEVTIRRDLIKLEARHLLRRTHGGAVRANHSALPDASALDAAADTPDALILAPVQHAAVHTLRERAVRNRIPLLAESCYLPGAVYVGPNNYEAAFRLGRWTGEYIQQHWYDMPYVLDITQEELPNTRTRSLGFAEGLRYVLGERMAILSVHGHGLYNDAYQVARDALALHPEINVIFGINDDSLLGALHAYLDLGRDPHALLAVNIGGEGRTLLDILQRGGPLKACMALFPEVVGRRSVEAVIRLWAGEAIGAEVITPSALLTSENLGTYYTPYGQEWALNYGAVEMLDQTRWPTPLPPAQRKRLSFVIHYRTHEWYQNLARAMQEHAARAGVTLSVVDVKDDLKAEIRELRRLIGKLAATYVKDGDTIILDSGTPTANMAQFLHGYNSLTVITNSLDVFQSLQSNPHVTLMLTGGDFHRESRSFVGRAGQLMLREIRADKAFIVAGGVSAAFGVSSKSQTEADIRRAMMDAAREVVVLADHTVLGQDAHARVAGLDRVNTLVTDAGAPSAYRLELNQRGIRVLVAGQLTNGSSSR